jgi:hypothetical protein
MDNKKLMQILLRDVQELEELVAGIRRTGSWELIEMELLSTRISGVRHMLQLVTAGSTQAVVPTPVEIVEVPSVKKAVDITATQEVYREAEPVSVPVNEVKPDVAPVNQAEPVSAPVKRMEQEVVPVAVHAAEPAATVGVIAEVTGVAEDNDEMELEEVVSSPQTFGETFTQGRSVNDLLLEHGKTDNKFSNMPVSSLQTAIGINDRFLFTRELFDGNGEAFHAAVKKIDSMPNIHEAAVYLREHYKWKKNETSLKFIDLVKRRFI